MIRARFQQRRNGKRYKKGQVIEGLSKEKEKELVRLGQADFEPIKPVKTVKSDKK